MSRQLSEDEIFGFEKSVKDYEAPRVAKKEAIPAEAIKVHHVTRTAAKRVLVVDDVDQIREVNKDLIEGLGYEVASAVDGLDACEQLRRARFDLVVTDNTMPKMTGEQLIAWINEHVEYTIKLLMLTGDVHDERSREAKEATVGAPVMAKPYDMDDFLTKVSELLNEESTQTTLAK